jgi:hypothetical protein
MRLITLFLMATHILAISSQAIAQNLTVFFKNSTDQAISNILLPNQVQAGPLLQGETRQLPDELSKQLQSKTGPIHIIASYKRYTCMGIDTMFFRHQMLLNITHLSFNAFTNMGIAHCELILKS